MTDGPRVSPLGDDKNVRQVSDSKRIHIRNARSIHRSDVDTVHGFSPEVSRDRALKSFRMLLDRCRRLVNELCIIQPLSIIIMCSVSFLP